MYKAKETNSTIDNLKKFVNKFNKIVYIKIIRRLYILHSWYNKLLKTYWASNIHGAIIICIFEIIKHSAELKIIKSENTINEIVCGIWVVKKLSI